MRNKKSLRIQVNVLDARLVEMRSKIAPVLTLCKVGPSRREDILTFVVALVDVFFSRVSLSPPQRMHFGLAWPQ